MVKKRFLTIILFIVGANIAVMAIALRNPDNLLLDDTTINLSNSDVFYVSETINPDKTLVPLGEFKGPDDIDQYIYEYEVTLNKAGALRASVDPNSIEIGDGLNNFNDLLVIQIYHNENEYSDNPNTLLIVPFTQWNEELGTYVLNISIRVFIKEPQNPEDYQSAYEALAGSNISFSILFEKVELS